MSEQEPWLSGPVDGVIAELQPVAHELLFAKEELDRIFADVRDDQLWQTPNGAASIGYHVRHCSGSTLRMLTYARGQALSDAQFQQLAAEKQPDTSLAAADLLRIAHAALDEAMTFVRATSAGQLDEVRLVGRKKLSSNVRGLLYEIATHTSRHIGQIATTARILR
jgi:DinB superfamily